MLLLAWILAISTCGPWHVYGFQQLYDIYSENWREKDCDKILGRIKHERVDVTVPPDIRGEWASQRCEVRSGPEFLLRKYNFSNNSFTVHQYYYSDPECSRPLFAFIAEGTFHYRGESWVISKSMETEYYINSAYVIPYTESAAIKLEARLDDSCLELSGRKWKPYQKYQISKFASYDLNEDLIYDENNDFVPDVDCMDRFYLTLNELQLIRAETRWKFRHHHGKDNNPKQQMVRELLLGSVHEDRHMRQLHRPHSFQSALRLVVTPDCHVCNRIGNSNEFYPPTLRPRHAQFVNLIGDWVSTRCESRENSMFVTRWINFLDNGYSFEAIYNYYFDPLCRVPDFTLSAKGSYGGGEPFSYIHGSEEYTFKVTRVKVTPHDKRTANNLNGYYGDKCGKPKSWKVGVEQDVTATQGCVTLGINIPNVAKELIKFEREHGKLLLFMGHRVLEGSEPTYRPTSFQEPLMKCRAPQITNDIQVPDPVYNSVFHMQKMTAMESGSDSHCSSEFQSLVLFALIASRLTFNL